MLPMLPEQRGRCGGNRLWVMSCFWKREQSKRPRGVVRDAELRVTNTPFGIVPLVYIKSVSGQGCGRGRSPFSLPPRSAGPPLKNNHGSFFSPPACVPRRFSRHAWRRQRHPCARQRCQKRLQGAGENPVSRTVLDATSSLGRPVVSGLAVFVAAKHSFDGSIFWRRLLGACSRYLLSSTGAPDVVCCGDKSLGRKLRVVCLSDTHGKHHAMRHTIPGDRRVRAES